MSPTTKRKPKGYWTLERCVEAAREFTRRADFAKHNNAAYVQCKKRKWLDEACAHMVSEDRLDWSDKSTCEAAALQCSHRAEFCARFRGASASAIRNGWYDEITSHMPKPHRWTAQSVAACANKYQVKAHFKRKAPGAYQWAKKHQLLDAVCAHMKVRSKPANYWSKRKVFAEAKKYGSRTAFASGNSGAYGAAKRNCWLDEACEHMPADPLDLRCVYQLINDQTREVYVGITKDMNARNHAVGPRPEVADLRKNGSYEQITQFIDAKLAAIIEMQFIRSYREDENWVCLNISNGGQLGSRPAVAL